MAHDRPHDPAALAADARKAHTRGMARAPKDNVIPFRPRRRTWTRPEDYGHYPREPDKPPRPPKRPKTDWRRMLRTIAVWAFIAALVAVAVAWDLWG